MDDMEDAQNIGELLRNSRLKKGKTLSDVSKDLCIRKVYLEAIESMDSKKLPPIPYCLGFVRSYANYLDMNAARIVQAYRQTAYPEQEDEAEEMSVSTNAPMENGGPSLKHILLGLAGLVVIFIFWTSVSSYNQQKAKEDSQDVVIDNVVPEPVIIEDNDTPVSEDEIIAETLEGNELKAETAEAEEAKPVQNEISDKVSSNAETPQIKADAKEKEIAAAPHIQIVLVGPSWLELKQGDKVLLSGIYSKGFKYDVPNEAGIILSVGRYYNVNLYVDGKLTKVASAMKQTNISLDKYILPEQKQE